jgi:hypothetical protein
MTSQSYPDSDLADKLEAFAHGLFSAAEAGLILEVVKRLRGVAQISLASLTDLEISDEWERRFGVNLDPEKCILAQRPADCADWMDQASAKARNAVIEECAKVAEAKSRYETKVFDDSQADYALSDTGKRSIQDRALARASVSTLIAKEIRALSQSPGTDATKSAPVADSSLPSGRKGPQKEKVA